jgi:CRISPR system Cascade subunit CasA
MTGCFSLAEQPFVPVRYLDGRLGRVGLRELFTQAHTIADIEAPTPPSGAAMLRVLYGMAFRIAARMEPRLADPDTVEDIRLWLRARNTVLEQAAFDPAQVNAYFDTAEAGLDLLDPARPAFQDPRLPEQCVDAKGNANPSGINKLVAGRPTGVNGAVLFGHSSDASPVPIEPGSAVWELLAQLYYGPSGQCTPRRVEDRKHGNGEAGPLRSTVSFHPWGPDLFTTLVLGIPPLDPDGADCDVDDPFPWEQTVPPDPLAPLKPLSWPAGVLTGRARHALLLVPTADRTAIADAYITWSTRQPPHPSLDPYLIYDTTKEGGFRSRRADLARSVWRDLDALLMNRGDHSRPGVFVDPRRLPAGLRTRLRVRAYGFAQEGQQRDFGWYTATTPPILHYFQEHDPDMAVRFEQCRTAAEDLGRSLEYAAKVAWAESVGRNVDQRKPGSWVGPATTAYWSASEAAFWRLVSPGDTERPHRVFHSAAETALKAAIGIARRDIRVAKAFRHAQAILWKAVPPTA